MIRRLDTEKIICFPRETEKDETRSYGLYHIYYRDLHFIVKARRTPFIDSDKSTTEVLDIKIIDWFKSEESYIRFKKPKRVTHTLQKSLEEKIANYERELRISNIDNSNWSF